MLCKSLRPFGKAQETGRRGRGDLIPAHAIEYNHNDATHKTPLRLLGSVIAERGH